MVPVWLLPLRYIRNGKSELSTVLNLGLLGLRSLMISLADRTFAWLKGLRQ